MPHKLCCTGLWWPFLCHCAISLATCPPPLHLSASVLRPSVFPPPPPPPSLPVCNPCLCLNMQALTAATCSALSVFADRTSCHYSHFERPGFMANEKRHAVPNHTPLTLPCGGCMSYFTLSTLMCVEGFHSRIFDWVSMAWGFFSFYPFKMCVVKWRCLSVLGGRGGAWGTARALRKTPSGCSGAFSLAQCCTQASCHLLYDVEWWRVWFEGAQAVFILITPMELMETPQQGKIKSNIGLRF